MRRAIRAALLIGAGWALAMSSPAPAAAATPLARYFPSQDLVAYAEFDGFDAHADVWKKTAAFRLLNQTTTGAMLQQLLTQFVQPTLSRTGQAMSIDDFRALAGHIARSGFAVGLIRAPADEKPKCVGVVLRGASRGKIGELVEKLIVGGRGPAANPQVVNGPGGRKITVEDGGVPQQGFAWWREGDDLAFSLASPAGADLMIEALDGRHPDATGHPGRADLARVENGFTPIALAFLEPSAPGGLPHQFVAFGLDQVKRIDYRWGIQGDAIMTVSRILAPAPRTGLLALFDQRTFDRKSLPPLPPGLIDFTAFSIDLADLYDRVSAGFANSDPASRAQFEFFEKAFRDMTGQRLRDDLLVHLGPKITFYALPARVNAPVNMLAGLAQGFFLTPGTAVVVEVKDVNAFSRIFDDAITTLQQRLKAEAAEGAPPPAVRVGRLRGAEHGYVASISPTAFPLPAGSKPTLILGNKSLVIGSTPEVARETLALESKGQGGALPATDALAASLDRLPGGLVFVNVSDARRSLLPELIANLPVLIQWGGALMTRSAGGRLMMMRARGMPPQRMNRPGLLDLAIDPDLVPAPDDLRPFLFPSELTLTTDGQGIYFTTRDAFPALNPVALAPVAAVILLPAMQSARAAARRSQSVNNLKQIGLALHNFHSANDHFPAGAVRDKNGKPLLSWRVTILPYLEQGALYNEFKLDEPWDSEHNKALLAKMPPVFAVPGAQAAPGNTFYRGFSGESTLFDAKARQGVGLRDVTDGTSNTIGIVEAAKAVPWTKPDEEIPFDPAVMQPAQLNALFKSLGGHFPGGFNALMLDGSVRFLKASINPIVLRALITRNQGEVVSADAF